MRSFLFSLPFEVDTTAALQRRCSGVAVALQRRCSGVATALQRRCSGIATALQRTGYVRVK